VEKKEVENQKIKIDAQLSRLVGNYGEENKIRQGIILLQEKLKKILDPKSQDVNNNHTVKSITIK